MLHSGKQKRFIIFIFCITKFPNMFVHSAQTPGAMLKLKNRKTKMIHFNFIGKMIHLICIIPILFCCYNTFRLGLKFELKHSL